MLKIFGYSFICAVIISLAACDSRIDDPAESNAQESLQSDTEFNWITHLAGRIFGEYGCDSFHDIQPEDFKDQHLFPGVLMKRYGVEAVYKSTWTNLADTVSGPLTVYCARFSGDLYAYGLYSCIPRGVDQTALRGGPSKRLGRTLVALKNRWVVWTVPAHEDKHPLLTDYELVFSGICKTIPGPHWMLPKDIRILGKLVPTPDSIQFRPENYLGLSFLNPAICAMYRSANGVVELFGILPHTREDGLRQLQAFKEWLENQGISAVYIETDERTSLYIDDKSMEPIYLSVDSYGLRGVKGLSSISDAQALLARWVP